MCNYIYKEMFCEHFVFLVDEWCDEYISTQKRCRPVIISKEYWGSEICSVCRDKQKPNTHPCAKLIKHDRRRSSPPLRRYDTTYCHEYHPATGLVVTKLKAPWVSREQHEQQQLRHQQHLQKQKQKQHQQHQHQQQQQEHGEYATPRRPRSGRGCSSALSTGAYSSGRTNTNAITNHDSNNGSIAGTANKQAYPLYVVSPQQNQSSFDRMPDNWG